MKFDLDALDFQQSDALSILPDLNTATLQQWFAREIIKLKDPRPGKAGVRRLSMLNILGIAFLDEARSNMGVGPSVSAEWLPDLEDLVRDFVGRHPPEISDEPSLNRRTGEVHVTPYPIISLNTADWADYRRLALYKDEAGKAQLDLLPRDEGQRVVCETLLPATYINFQVDRFVARIINKLLQRMYERGALPGRGGEAS